MILLIDNYDSFVFNLARYFQQLGHETIVRRNDSIDIAKIRQLRPGAIVISPGPCTPQSAGCSVEVVRQLYDDLPILGVCLGHQAIAEAFGGRIVRAARPMHGRTSAITHDAQGVFAGLPSPLDVCRYHSLVIDPERLPAELEISATTADGTIMGVGHRKRPLVGVQFHPESILTKGGYRLLANFLKLSGLAVPDSLPADEQVREKRVTDVGQTPQVPVTF